MDTPSSLPLSVVLIARNEARNLPTCLDAVAGWVREIVVVVNDCTDGTEEIARRYGARVIPHPWENFREQKNVALAQATQPWILALDADERITPALRGEIVAFLAGADADQSLAAESPRLVTFLGRAIRHGDWYPDRGLRLVRRGQARWTGAHDHCKLVAEGRGPIHRFRSDLDHASFPDLASLVRKTPFHADNFVRTCRERGRRWHLLQAVIRPPWRFFRGYVLKRGFLDGYPGLVVAVAVAYETFIRYARLYESELASSSASE
ncbi:Glycosyltransferase involved in cell wall bisynthesis [Verrucomicrobium sp. GAS474]|uniref:glycosyltransferase family 2 protein n=1 Tax=Verrucomicrobium sp. GAS474 TaxID=1882831 RepID=UPI00087CA487|nr:glycosyltransferase family 2 protein [Verrucomicrobium sp. GAS474]SDU10439.1 Glycosyltransferase involved in cell wall bisynthesis [Verrucomicrobium sp. GAS474]